MHVAITLLLIAEDKVTIVLLFLDNWIIFDAIMFQILLNIIFSYIFLLKSIKLVVLRSLCFIYIYFLNLWVFPYEFSVLWIFKLLILLSTDIHPNPGPGPNYNTNRDFSNGFFSFCNWNLNTLSKDNFNRISLLEAHNTIFNYDIISLCETSLNDETPVPENALPGYKYHPLNHPSGVGIFYKDTLPIRIRDDLSFTECLVTELIFGRKKNSFWSFIETQRLTQILLSLKIS